MAHLSDPVLTSLLKKRFAATKYSLHSILRFVFLLSALMDDMAVKTTLDNGGDKNRPYISPHFARAAEFLPNYPGPGWMILPLHIVENLEMVPR